VKSGENFENLACESLVKKCENVKSLVKKWEKSGEKMGKFGENGKSLVKT